MSGSVETSRAPPPTLPYISRPTDSTTICIQEGGDLRALPEQTRMKNEEKFFCSAGVPGLFDRRLRPGHACGGSCRGIFDNRSRERLHLSDARRQRFDRLQRK